MMNKTARFCSALVVFAIVLAAGCASTHKAMRTEQSGRTPEASTQVKVGTWRTAQTIQPFLYQKFMPEGVKVEVLPFTNPGDQKAALLAGSLDMCGTTLVTALAAASRGEPVVIVCSLCNKCSALVVRKDSDIKTVRDLKGKRIGYVPGTMHHILILEALTRAGLDPAHDVKLVRVDFFDMAQALAQGAIDAFCSGEPYPTLAVKQGTGRILEYPYYGESIGTINAAMITTRTRLQQDPKLLTDLVWAHCQATRQLQADPTHWLDLAADFGTDRDVLELCRPNMQLAWDINAAYIEHARHLAERMRALGLIKQMPDMSKLFDLSLLKTVHQRLQAISAGSK